MEGHTKIIINIKDVNDLPPIFDNNVYTTTLLEEHEGPYPVRALQVNIQNSR